MAFGVGEVAFKQVHLFFLIMEIVLMTLSVIFFLLNLVLYLNHTLRKEHLFFSLFIACHGLFIFFVFEGIVNEASYQESFLYDQCFVIFYILSWLFLTIR